MHAARAKGWGPTQFQRELEEMLSNGTAASPVTNLDIYRFTLEKGFLPKHASAHLKELRKAGKLAVVDTESGADARKNASYLDWDYYKEGRKRTVFRLKD